MLHKKISLHFAFLITAAGMAITFAGERLLEKKDANDSGPVVVNTASECSFTLARLNGYKYIGPLLFGEELCEAKQLMPIKNEVENLINTYKTSSVITNASVYLKELSNGQWISIGETEKYNPGSLLKVPELITFMKMREKDPRILDRMIAYNKPLVLKKQAYFLSKSIEVGKTYSIRELLYYMIAYSDNNATMLLNAQMDLAVFKKIFTDLGLPEPDMTKSDIPVSAKDFSLFMRVLYNASYLNIDDSEYCTELLSHSDFKIGLLNGLPSEIRVAHKFGEANDGVNEHLNESGIFYIDKNPYLLTVMTKGKDTKLLPSVISDISKKVFEMMERI